MDPSRPKMSQGKEKKEKAKIRTEESHLGGKIPCAMEGGPEVEKSGKDEWWVGGYGGEVVLKYGWLSML